MSVPAATPPAPPPCAIRRLVPADAADYRALMLDAYARHPDAFTSTAEERAALPLAWWQQRLSTEAAATELVWGAFADGALVGVAGLELQVRKKIRHKATLFGMFVAPAARGRGIAKKLVATLVGAARARSELTVLQLTVTGHNASALRLYESGGFLRWGEEPDAVRWQGTSRAKLHLWLPLR